jgi:hypothetical protein
MAHLRLVSAHFVPRLSLPFLRFASIFFWVTSIRRRGFGTDPSGVFGFSIGVCPFDVSSGTL